MWRTRLVNNITDCPPVFVEEVEKQLAGKVLLMIMQFGYLQSKFTKIIINKKQSQFSL